MLPAFGHLKGLKHRKHKFLTHFEKEILPVHVHATQSFYLLYLNGIEIKYFVGVWYAERNGEP